MGPQPGHSPKTLNQGLMVPTPACCVQYLTFLGKNTQPNNNCMANFLQSQITSEKGVCVSLDIVGEQNKNSSAIHCYGHLAMDTLELVVLLELTSTNSAQTLDVILLTSRTQCGIVMGGVNESGRSEHARPDDDDDRYSLIFRR